MQYSNNDSKNQMYKHVIDSKVFPFLFKDENMSELKQNKFMNDRIINALCVLCFDDEIGQVTENIWPEYSLNKETIKNISGLGFPETNSLTDDGEIQFVFKIRQSN